MDPKVLYWTGAMLNMLLIVGLFGRGVRLIRRREVAAHRRSMLSGGALVLAFLVSYVIKLMFLGREDLGVWSDFYVNTLRFHEACVLSLLLAGGFAVQRGWSLRATRNVTGNPADPPAPIRTLQWHRRAGWTAVVGAVLGWLSACVVLSGMYQRL